MSTLKQVGSWWQWKKEMILEFVPDHFMTQEMCTKTVSIKPWVREIVKAYEHRKAQKAAIKYELLPVAWHPDRYFDWCYDDSEKKTLERLWG